MPPSLSLGRLARLGAGFVAVSLLGSGCAGRSLSHEDDAAAANGSGATGGDSPGSGGTGESSGGTFGAGDAAGSGATGGGSGNVGTGGRSDVGGSTDPGKGGFDSGATGGSGATPNCANVVCPSIPTTCEKIVQPPDECCPICPDTGCGECKKPTCEDNQHLETIPGDCCPSCVADPPDACEAGQASSAALRDALIEKYGSESCKNSSECTLVVENNACAVSCPIALPTTTISNFTVNLENAAHACASCDVPDAPPCPDAAAACVNGECVTTVR